MVRYIQLIEILFRLPFFEMNPLDAKFTILVMGDPNIGKSKFLYFLDDDQIVPTTMEKLTSVPRTFQFGSKFIESQLIKISNLDDPLTNDAYKNVVGVLLLYDVTNRNSFNSIPSYLNKIRAKFNKEIVIVLVGNKDDLENSKEVSFREGESYADQEKLLFTQVSTKHIYRIKTAFRLLVDQVCRKMFPEEALIIDEKRKHDFEGEKIENCDDDREEENSQFHLINRVENPDYYLKMILVGNAPGKTSLHIRLIQKKFILGTTATIGLDSQFLYFKNKEKTIRLLLYDSSSRKDTTRIMPHYFRDMNGCAVMYDMTNRESFVDAKFYLNLFYEQYHENVCFILVGSKCDLF
ncbi:hypothetical protein TRFO_14561 [Tritrichomonas foetus]|uniref:Ras family protein n=1 Tax=Tritrichomonas foetus TaxID=1144522 RepID=A0A1J4KV69_9EUKA|nr:hypothetical protein TRFO_14561 [Tritrichomonas foetus]|eukprot:OHT15042.1 hypothetical protein TRFO_14561 [Tritrichomonas foetus]